MTTEEKVALVEKHMSDHGLNQCLKAIGLAKSTWYYRQNHQGPSVEDKMLTAEIKHIIADHPDYGYRRILPELSERTGVQVNHKRLKRLLRKHDLSLRRCLPRAKPSSTRRVISRCTGELNLVKGRSFGPLEAFSTDFTELHYRDGKAHLMAMVDIASKFVAGWSVGASANRELALQCWNRVKERLAQLDVGTAGLIVHHDQDSVYTSYDWLQALLIEGGAKVSYSEHGAKDNPWIESLWGRFKVENGSLIAEAQSLSRLRAVIEDRFQYYNRERRHSALQYVPPSTYLHHHPSREDAACNP